jgi:hypothetical protein
MDDALLVRGLERLGDLSGNRHGLIDWNRPPGDPLVQAFAIDEFQHEVLWFQV